MNINFVQARTISPGQVKCQYLTFMRPSHPLDPHNGGTLWYFFNYIIFGNNGEISNCVCLHQFMCLKQTEHVRNNVWQNCRMYEEWFLFLRGIVGALEEWKSCPKCALFMISISEQLMENFRPFLIRRFESYLVVSCCIVMGSTALVKSRMRMVSWSLLHIWLFKQDATVYIYWVPR